MRSIPLAAVLFAIAPFPWAVGAQTIERISVSSDEEEANADSLLFGFDALSADGRFVVFESDASNLVPADGNGLRDVFLRDRLLGATVRVSEAWNGGDATGESRYPSISEDGRWIAFSSDAPNIVADDTNGFQDVFLYDRQTRQMSRVSMAWDGGEGNGDSRTPSVSSDGRFVAFRSNATNMVAEPAMAESRSIYVRDLQTGVTVIASRPWDGSLEDGGSWYPNISADGLHVGFNSGSTNLISVPDTLGKNDPFVRHLEAGVTELISVNVNGGYAEEDSGRPCLSADGGIVGIFSNASDVLPPGQDTNGVGDAFVRDLGLGVTERVSIATGGAEANGSSGSAAVDGSGRYAAFWSTASNLVDGDVNQATDIFSRDRATAVTVLLSLTASGMQGDGVDDAVPSMTADGRFIAFSSHASNLVPDDTLGFQDVFIAHGPATTLADGFETGDTSRWSAAMP